MYAYRVRLEHRAIGVHVPNDTYKTQKLPLLKKGAHGHDFEVECTLTSASNGEDWILKVVVTGATPANRKTKRTVEQNYRREPLRVAQNGAIESIKRVAAAPSLLNCKATDVEIAPRIVWTKL
jgi:hypothetical protein